ncbi:hypothetical protein [Janthinobacterium fluminis]|uniref:Uncharacterized protein n=1 Tax=Janthinobacterium fluminis TaxID=2987524 RepID=A0ABT5K364_9BURK|nr:hypothetical protein [Janthinobacterium fluminis]MDC8758187.1 hypothetical protein [Janthinobacterium fluminis]
MKFRHCCALAAWVLLSPAFAAEPAKVSDAHAPVPSSAYISVLAQYQPAVEPAEPADQFWRAANKALAAKAGTSHMGQMPPAGSAPKAADPHPDHSMHHQHKGKQ